MVAVIQCFCPAEMSNLVENPVVLFLNFVLWIDKKHAVKGVLLVGKPFQWYLSSCTKKQCAYSSVHQFLLFVSCYMNFEVCNLQFRLPYLLCVCKIGFFVLTSEIHCQGSDPSCRKSIWLNDNVRWVKWESGLNYKL